MIFADLKPVIATEATTKFPDSAIALKFKYDWDADLFREWWEHQGWEEFRHWALTP